MNVLAALLAASLVAAPPEFTAKTIDGRQIRGTLSGWEENALVFRTGQKDEKIALGQLLSVAPSQAAAPSPPASTIWVTLTDGSVIAARSCLAESAEITVTATRPQSLKLPRDSVSHVGFREATPALEERWKEILDRPADQDLLVVVSGETLDYLEGIVRAVREEHVDFEVDGDVVPVRRTKVFAVRYYHPKSVEDSEQVARIRDDAGSTWAARRVEISPSGDQLEVESLAGVHVSLPLQAVADIEFAASGLVFLSDLKADSSQWTHYFGRETSLPSLERLYRPRSNTALDNGPLVLDGVSYKRGLALHSRTEMTYRLAEPFKRFQALAGIDDRLRPQGNVDLKILGDDRILFQAAIAGTDPSQPIDVSLQGVKSLTIVVDFGSDLDVGDHLILAEAKLLK